MERLAGYRTARLTSGTIKVEVKLEMENLSRPCCIYAAPEIQKAIWDYTEGQRCTKEVEQGHR